MKATRKFLTLTVLASLVVGGCAGVVASILTSNALENYATTLLGDRGFTALEPRKPNTNPLDYDQAIRKVRDAQSRSVAMIVSKTVDGVVPERWIGPQDAQGLGVVVSANGWILTTAEELSAFKDPADTAEVWVRGTRYSIGEVISDTLTSYVLLRLTDASGLSPIGFGASEDARNGDMMFVLPGSQEIAANAIQNSEAIVIQGPLPAEAYAAAWQLTGQADFHGPVISTGGDVLGFVTDASVTIPLHHGVAFVQEVIRGGSFAHAGLGAYVVDLSDVYNLNAELRQGLSTGALVIAPAGEVAVLPGGPAAQAGLLMGDIITAVDGEALTPNVSLAEMLATYDPTQTARLNIVRKGSPLEISVVLSDASGLVY